MADRSFTLREYVFSTFLLLWPWLWPDDLRIQTWPVFPRGIPDVGKWTSYIKVFDSYRLIETDRQTDATEIIHHAVWRVVKNSTAVPEWHWTCDLWISDDLLLQYSQLTLFKCLACAFWPYSARTESHRKSNVGIRVPNATCNNSQFTTEMLKVKVTMIYKAQK